MRYAPLLLTALMLAGCASPKSAISPSAAVQKSYEIGETYEVTTGSRVLAGARAYTLPTFSPVEGFVTPPTPRGEEIRAAAGGKWVAAERGEDGSYYLFPPGRADAALRGAGAEAGVMGATLARYSNVPQLHVTESGEIIGWDSPGSRMAAQLPSKDGGGWPEQIAFERVDGELLEGSFQFELLYTGTSGDEITLVYREYLDGLARSDFSQELSYDLSEGDGTISFRSLKIDVLEAGNNSIRYRVVQDQDLPWLPNR